MFKLEIRTANVAFDEEEGNAGPELARILRELADRVEGGVPTGDNASVRDVNGNRVGEWSYEDETN
jgi:hypothetical protein